ncbi:MAG: PQQ-binding-like beta-propeller repeat protein [Bryobacterales bacterium]|nr:PQQ-binding-like beta-propeller repeat protein [Bryobacterales bacterium]
MPTHPLRLTWLGLSFALLSPALAQPTTPDIKQTYLKLCAGCHGDDALGTQQGPGLAGNPWVRRRSLNSLKTVIRNGVPKAGMPPFALPAEQIDALAAMVVSLNAVAAEASVPGDPSAGAAFFTGPGRCLACHMVNGAGAPTGPDLTNIARELTLQQLREALLEPAARIAPGYAQVTAHLKNGRTLQGFARNRTSFDLALQDRAGAVHPLSLDDVTRIDDTPGSLMPPVPAAAPQLTDLIAYLATLKGVTPGAPAQSTATPAAAFQRILNPPPGEWLTYNGNLNGNRYSELKQITTQNVGKLALKWAFSIPLWQQFLPDTPYFRENMRYFGLETVPLVADGVMYATGPNSVYALDPRTGTPIWQFSRPRTPGLVSDPSLGTNRGVAILGDKLFFVTDNAHLLALHRTTGKLIWETVMPHEPQKYGGTIAPLVVKNLVIAGVAGGDWGIRGFIDAYHADTGQRAWRHWTVPAAGEPGFDTWRGSAVQYGGGSTWLTGSYDAESDTLYWATGNPWPNSDDSQRGGDNLYTDSVLALHPNTGKLKWYYQFTPHDTRDWDATEPNVLINTTYRGRERKLLLQANRNGFFYVFDRLTGERLLNVPFVRKLTWASGIGPDGKPIRLPEPELSCPDHATNWNGTTYSPATRLYYIMATEKCVAKLAPGGWKNQRTPPPPDPGTKYLRALDIETGKIVWDVPQAGPTDGKRVAGTLGTAGGLLFYGDALGYFIAADERTGKTLWRVPLNATMKTSPMTFSLNGEQYIALAVGSNILCFGLSK